MVPLYLKGGVWHLLLCRRSDRVAEHAGEVAFPGGRPEKGDADLLQCALREAQEEVGIRPEDAVVIGPLDPVTTRTNYLVWPTVVSLPDAYPFVPNPQEVGELLEVPVASLLYEACVRHEAFLQSDGSLVERRTYTAGHHLVFGATALILAQLLHFFTVPQEAPS